jgi:hypothetical protein
MGEPRKCLCLETEDPVKRRDCKRFLQHVCVCVCVLVNKFGAICDKTEEMPEILCC